MAVQSHAVRALQCASYFRAPDGDVLKGLTFEACLIYLDDVIIGGRTFEEHLQNIRKVLSKLSDANLKLNPSKCKFFQKEVNYLGHHLCRRSFDVFTDLNISTTDKPFILDTDASNESVGAVLSQEIDGQERVVAYWSKCLSKPERNYCVTRKEILAIVKAIEHFHHYLYGQKFLLRTDHASLTWLMNFRNTEGQEWCSIPKIESEDGKTFRWQLVLPRSRIPEVLKELHGSPTGGHFGVMKTLHRVRERFFWGKVRADVEQWCKSCDACSARKGPKIRSRGKLHRYNVGAPFERIAFDILGPLPRTASGNKYLLVVMDYFTKWPEVYPIPIRKPPP
ncbi:retrovirus-related Pol polyprotein from transposon 412 [Trichonephila clavipes]|uniref:RNA-directed DNA polymerase n=1 Tax=Trichonephila clavipes TaxID=2585209 RepID=A0A8X6RV78_TRICX|nr:retrovirus-related Pol polyprotein from transposon 412 [Trichonephila clavipes]